MLGKGFFDSIVYNLESLTFGIIAMTDKSVTAYINDNAQRNLEELFELLRFESIANNPTADGCGPCADWLTDKLNAIGMDNVQILPGDRQPYVFAEKIVDPAAPTVLFYAHYDVQPADPLEQWHTPPFEPTIKGDYIFARGACDNKGPLMAQLAAIEAAVKTDRLKVNVKILFEGEEEIGSPGIEEFLEKHSHLLACDVISTSDMLNFASGVPSMVSSLRGLCAFEISFTGPVADVHSGMEGGVISNPINALAKLIAAFHDDDGRVTIPGFYDDVREVSPQQLEQWKKLPFDEKAHAKRHNVSTLAGGEAGLHPLVRNWARPTLDCNGIIGGYTGKGAKTIIPSRAAVKITCRLVPDQSPEKICKALEKFVIDHTPAGMTADVTIGPAGKAVCFDTTTPYAQAAAKAIEVAFKKSPIPIGGGGSVPITEWLQRIIGSEVVIMCLGLPDDNFHSPNERFRMDMLENGRIMIAEFLMQVASSK